VNIAVSSEDLGGSAVRQSDWAEPQAILVLIRFRVCGDMRFVSHAEMLKVFERACRRADIEIEYTQGFNPRPKLSLPLPRSVGVESDDELLCLRVNCTLSELETGNYESRIESALRSQLPEHVELLSVAVAKQGAKFRPCSAVYFLPVRNDYLDDRLNARVQRLLASKTLSVTRISGPGTGRVRSAVKNIDVRPFLRSIEVDNWGIMVDCKITSAGSIRIEEILKLLELDVQMLAAPIKRMTVQWEESRA
jgi:radical SAM-linked protein